MIALYTVFFTSVMTDNYAIIFECQSSLDKTVAVVCFIYFLLILELFTLQHEKKGILTLILILYSLLVTLQVYKCQNKVLQSRAFIYNENIDDIYIQGSQVYNHESNVIMSFNNETKFQLLSNLSFLFDFLFLHLLAYLLINLSIRSV